MWYWYESALLLTHCYLLYFCVELQVDLQSCETNIFCLNRALLASNPSDFSFFLPFFIMFLMNMDYLNDLLRQMTHSFCSWLIKNYLHNLILNADTYPCSCLFLFFSATFICHISPVLFPLKTIENLNILSIFKTFALPSQVNQYSHHPLVHPIVFPEKVVSDLFFSSVM